MTAEEMVKLADLADQGLRDLEMDGLKLIAWNKEYQNACAPQNILDLIEWVKKGMRLALCVAEPEPEDVLDPELVIALANELLDEVIPTEDPDYTNRN